jgi:hypothetical protein
MDINNVRMAIHRLDLDVLSPDKVDILQRILPTADEEKALRDYEQSKKPIDALTVEEQFVYQLSKIERCAHKLQIMLFMANFDESAKLIQPVIVYKFAG